MKLRSLIISVLSCTIMTSTAMAHEGHIHAPSIGRDSVPLLKKCIPPYLEIQAALAEGRLDEKLKTAAEELAKQAREGGKAESDASGRTMFMEIYKGASAIASAPKLEAARESFGEINKSTLPFFIIWSAHLKSNGLTLFYCADKEALSKRDKIDFTKGWMQKEDKPKNPYGTTLCSDLQIEKGEN